MCPSVSYSRHPRWFVLHPTWEEVNLPCDHFRWVLPARRSASEAACTIGSSTVELGNPAGGWQRLGRRPPVPAIIQQYSDETQQTGLSTSEDPCPPPLILTSAGGACRPGQDETGLPERSSSLRLDSSYPIPYLCQFFLDRGYCRPPDEHPGCDLGPGCCTFRHGPAANCLSCPPVAPRMAGRAAAILPSFPSGGLRPPHHGSRRSLPEP